MAVMIYTFAYAAMKSPLFRGSSVLRSVEELADDEEAEQRGTGKKYRTSSLDDAKKKNLLNALLVHMEHEQPHRDPETSLDDMAEAIGVSAHDLSQILNEVLGVNFYAFLNGYRVEAVKEMMADTSHDHRTLLALGLDAGFNSKTSFNRVFKEETGMTPSELRRQLRGRRSRPRTAPPAAARGA